MEAFIKSFMCVIACLYFRNNLLTKFLSSPRGILVDGDRSTWNSAMIDFQEVFLFDGEASVINFVRAICSTVKSP